jgi:hypothetical protein
MSSRILFCPGRGLLQILKINSLLYRLTVSIILITPSFMLPMAATDIAAAQKEVGSIKEIRGNSNILREREKIDAQKNGPVFKADTVRTFEKSKVKILFVDDSLVIDRKSVV